MALAVGMFLALLPVVNAEGTATVVSPDGVNLRSGPGTSFAVLTVIPFSATVSVSGSAGEGWYPVTYQGLSGFVLGEYLRLNDAPAPERPQAASPAPAPTPVPAPAPLPLAQSQLVAPAPTATPAPAPQPQTDVRLALVTPPDGLNLRAGPSVAYPVVTTAPGSARVQVVGRPTPDGWYSVIYNTKLGWVDGKYLNFNVPALPAPAPGQVVTPPVPVANSRFVWPVESRRISTLFSGGHPGIDVDEFPSGGNPVVAVAPGTVIFAGGSMCCSYGLHVIVRHAEGYTSLYAHLASIGVQEGQEVGQGKELGKSGNTGFSTGAHLHFELKKDGAPLNPLSLLPGAYRTD